MGFKGRTRQVAQPMVSSRAPFVTAHTGVKFCQISSTKVVLCGHPEVVLCGHLSLLQCTAFVLIQIPPPLSVVYWSVRDCVLASGMSREKSMGRIFVVELEGRPYRCKFCRTHLALPNDVVSRGFHSRHGKAYLFNNAVNITMGSLEERMMLSGMHTVADIFCCCCGQIVGWKYQLAHDNAQEYKEGKFVLERGRIIDEMDGSTDIFMDNHQVSDAEDA